MKKFFLLFLVILGMADAAIAQVPTITGVANLTTTTLTYAGKKGDKIRITGTNFNSTSTANNIVYFGSTRATVTTATATTLTVTVSDAASSDFITVTNVVTKLTAFSPRKFTVMFPCGGVIDATSFDTRVNFVTNSNPQHIVTSDFNADGLPDLASDHQSNVGTYLSIYKNTSTSSSISFAGKADFLISSNTSSSPSVISVGDLDGNGLIDIILTNTNENKVYVYRNTSTIGGAISFSSPVTYATGAGPWGLSIFDINADGKLDIITSNANGNSVSVIKNNSTTSAMAFLAKVDFTVGSSPRGLTVCEIDGDGKPEILAVNMGANNFSILRNTSTTATTSFAAKVDIPTGTSPDEIKSGDLDGDGKLDIVVGNRGDSFLSIYRNTATLGTISTSSFSPKVDLTVNAATLGVGISDVDGDGKIDITSCYGNAVNGIHKNKSTSGSLTTSSFTYSLINSSESGAYNKCTIGDFNKDGKPDLAVLSNSSKVISVLKNIVLAPQLSSTTTPPSICTGSTFAYSATANVTGATITWTRAAVAGITNAAGSGSGNVSEVLTNNTANPINVTYVYTTALNGCSNSKNVVVTVNPKPTISSTLTPPAICSGSAFSYTPQSATTNATFAWTRAAVTGISNAANSGTGNPNETLTNTTNSPINVTYVYTASIGGCSGASSNVVVTVNPKPTISSSLTPPAICSGSAFSYTPQSATTNATFAWTRAAVTGISNAANSGSGNPNETLTNTTNSPINVTYVYTASIGGCIGASSNVVVSVKPIPTASLGSYTAQVCDMGFIQASFTLGAAGGQVNYWYNTTGMPIFPPNGSGTGNMNRQVDLLQATAYNLSFAAYPSLNGCNGNTFNFDVLIHPNPVMSSAATASIYNGEALNIGLASDITSNYSWVATDNTNTSGESTTAKTTATIDDRIYNPTTTDQTVNYNVTPTAAATGCVGAAQAVTVTVKPTLKITSFTPTSGKIGTTVVITGTNFNTTAANNIVYFGAVRATVTAATATSITVTVPAGATYDYLSVTDIISGNKALTPNKFTPTFNCGGQIYSSGLEVAARYPFSSWGPWYTSVGDLNLDGLPDIVAIDVGTNEINIYKNNSMGANISFVPQINSVCPEGFFSSELSDINGDGLLDFVGVGERQNSLYILLNNSTPGGSISFNASPIIINVGPIDPPLQLMYMKIRDLNADGKPEIAVTARNSIFILRNSSTLTNVNFSRIIELTGFNSQARELDLGDLDNDGLPEIVATNMITDIVIFKNTSSATNDLAFILNQRIPTTNTGSGIRLVDLNNDNKLDIATYYDLPQLDIFKNSSTSTISFNNVQVLPTVTEPNHFGLNVGDIDGDGFVDIVLADNWLGGTAGDVGVVRFFKNNSTANGAISLSSSINFPLEQGVFTPLVNDFNGDGKPDVVLMNDFDENIVIIKNNTYVGPPVTVTPSKAICLGNSTTLNAAGASTYAWSPTTALSPTTGANVTATPNVSTLYTVTGTDANGCVSSANTTVSVLSMEAGANQAVCQGASAQLQASLANNYSWFPQDGLSNPSISNPVASPQKTTTYSVRAFCGGKYYTDQVTVTVNPGPTLTIPSTTYAICPGTSVLLNTSGTGTFVWSPTTGLTGPTTATPTAAPTASTNYKVTLTNTNGCSTTGYIDVLVNPLNVSPVETPLTIEKGSIVKIGAETSGFVGKDVSYSWSPAADLDNATSKSPTAKPAVTTTYNVTATAGACTDQTSVLVNVIDAPTAVFDYTNCNGVCTFTTKNTGNFTYLWQFGDNTTDSGANPTHTYAADGSYSVCLKVTGQTINGQLQEKNYCTQILVQK